MSAERLATIDRVVTKGIKGGGFPGAAVVVGRGGFSILQKGFGRTGWTAKSPSVSTDETVYDIASLTKVVGVTTAAMILFDEGKLDLDAPVQQYLPEFRGARKEGVTMRHLLTHHSGLPAGRILYREATTPAQARKVVLETPLACAPGKCFVYSDLGAITLGLVIERISGEKLDVFLERRIFAPLKMADTRFKPPASWKDRIAPTADVSRRGYEIRGEVHDDNAYVLGGVVGHAGLFSTAADLAVFAQMMLNKGAINGTRIVAESTVVLFTARQAGPRALGWEMAEKVRGAGDYFSESAYGHTGFTGTSIWIDPERQLFVVLLTNRVYAPRARRPSEVISNVRNDLADAAALSITDDPDFPRLDMPAAFRADTAKSWNRPTRSR
jgi:CubicO group peptidase (beta-lactamase class C family)